MVYVKNVPMWERAVRVMMGAAMAAGGFFGLHGGVTGYGLVAMGAMAAATGFFGFCPACASSGESRRSRGALSRRPGGPGQRRRS